MFSMDIVWENIDKKTLLFWTYFRSDFRQIRRFLMLDPPNFVEAVLNLFMKLQTSTLIKLDNLDIKLEVI